MSCRRFWQSRHLYGSTLRPRELFSLGGTFCEARLALPVELERLRGGDLAGDCRGFVVFGFGEDFGLWGWEAVLFVGELFCLAGDFRFADFTGSLALTEGLWFSEWPGLVVFVGRGLVVFSVSGEAWLSLAGWFGVWVCWNIKNIHW